MDLELIITSFPKLLSATVVTLKLLSASLFFGLILGLFFAIPVSYTHLTLPTIYSV